MKRSSTFERTSDSMTSHYFVIGELITKPLMLGLAASWLTASIVSQASAESTGDQALVESAARSIVEVFRASPDSTEAAPTAQERIASATVGYVVGSKVVGSKKEAIAVVLVPKHVMQEIFRPQATAASAPSSLLPVSVAPQPALINGAMVIRSRAGFFSNAQGHSELHIECARFYRAHGLVENTRNAQTDFFTLQSNQLSAAVAGDTRTKLLPIVRADQIAQLNEASFKMATACYQLSGAFTSAVVPSQRSGDLIEASLSDTRLNRGCSGSPAVANVSDGSAAARPAIVGVYNSAKTQGDALHSATVSSDTNGQWSVLSHATASRSGSGRALFVFAGQAMRAPGAFAMGGDRDGAHPNGGGPVVNGDAETVTVSAFDAPQMNSNDYLIEVPNRLSSAHGLIDAKRPFWVCPNGTCLVAGNRSDIPAALLPDSGTAGVKAIPVYQYTTENSRWTTSFDKLNIESVTVTRRSAQLGQLVSSPDTANSASINIQSVLPRIMAWQSRDADAIFNPLYPNQLNLSVGTVKIKWQPHRIWVDLNDDQGFQPIDDENGPQNHLLLRNARTGAYIVINISITMIPYSSWPNGFGHDELSVTVSSAVASSIENLQTGRTVRFDSVLYQSN